MVSWGYKEISAMYGALREIAHADSKIALWRLYFLLGEWLPIETAPKSEIPIIVGWWQEGAWTIRGARWVDGVTLYELGVADWKPEDTGWWGWRGSVNEHLQGLQEPTHWFPAPELPGSPPEDQLRKVKVE